MPIIEIDYFKLVYFIAFLANERKKVHVDWSTLRIMYQQIIISKYDSAIVNL